MQKQVVISTRVPAAMAKEISAIVGGDYFLNEADFVRSALRNEIFKHRVELIKKEYTKDKNSVKAVRKLRKLTSQLSEEDYDKWVRKNTKDMP